MPPDLRFPTDAHWPYLPTLTRLALALALGLFVGLEREQRGKEAGMRTFGFAALLGCLGGLLGDALACRTIRYAKALGLKPRKGSKSRP